MSIKNCCYYMCLPAVLFAGCNNAGHSNIHKTAGGTAINYQLVKNWPNLPAQFVLGSPTGIGIDSNQHILIFHRGTRKWPVTGAMPETVISSTTILMLDRNTGQILKRWGDSLFIMPHGLTVDSKDNIWVTDAGLQQVLKFSHDGKLLMKLGEAKIAGSDSLHFNRPTDVAVAEDGSFYVSDGYGNSRVIKFSATGKYLFEWGKKGKAEGEFDIPHAIVLDEKENVYVADRENNRVEVFDAAGHFIQQWNGNDFGRICSVIYDRREKQFIAVDDAVSFFALQHRGSDIIVFDIAGNILNRFGRSGFYDGPKCWYHDAAIDDEGNIYTADILGNSIQKFKRVVAN